MKTTVFVVAAILSAALGAQEKKPVPKDSARVFVPGCAKGRIFTAGPRTEDLPGAPVPEGTHLRMSGPKELLAEIKSHAGSRIEITGLMKKGQFGEGGIRIGRGVRITPGPSSAGGGLGPDPGVSQIMIDVEGWRQVAGDCPLR